ncbi:MAG: tRNA modification GTPase, partial [Bacteroidota bacterium]
DLAQAEAIGDLIHASSTAAHRASLSHLKGRYSELLAGLRSELLELAAFIELELDFSDEDVEFADRDRLETLLARVDDTLSRLLASYPLGERLREGVRVVIGGRPNAGKSTLLNALVGHERAIVSAQPGTTRDEIEVDAEIGGLRFRFVDTAGIRLTDDAVEAEGVRRARRAIDLADILIYVYDAARGLEPDEESLIAEIQVARSDLPFIVVANKLDLAPGAPADHLGLSATAARQDERLLVPLIDRMSQAATDGITDVDASAVVMNQRHVQHLKTALAAVERARRAMRHGESGDLLALDLRTALDELGAITGEITNEDVLDQIFSRFCIGK